MILLKLWKYIINMRILKDSKYFKYEQDFYWDMPNNIFNGLQLDNFNIYSLLIPKLWKTTSV